MRDSELDHVNIVSADTRENLYVDRYMFSSILKGCLGGGV